VRLATIAAVCDIAEASPRMIPVDLLKAVGDRMLDKKASVRQGLPHFHSSSISSSILLIRTPPPPHTSSSSCSSSSSFSSSSF